MNISNILEKINFLFKHDYYYLYIMSIYHILIILFTLLEIKNIPSKVFFILDFNISNIKNITTLDSNIKSIIFSLLIIFVDFIFLIIMMYEFKSLKLTYSKIFIIEIPIFILAFYNPIFRMILLFLSLNTLQITFFWKIIRYIPFMKYIFIFGAYIFIIKLFIFIIFNNH